MANVPHRRRGVKRGQARRPLGTAAMWCALGTGLLILAACREQAPSGQVIATVNGEEVTLAELNAEARARQLSIGNDLRLRDALIAELIERKLLVAAALERGIDHTPEHLLAERRSDEILLAQELVGAIQRERPEPTAGELATLVRARPYAFDQRALLSVDRIVAPPMPNSKLARELDAAASLDAAQALLVRAGLRPERKSELWDSATLAPDLAGKLVDQQGARPLIVRLPDQTLVAQVLTRIAQPTPGDQRLNVARELLRGEGSRDIVQRFLAQQRAQAKIRYQPRFSPTR